MTEPRFHLSHQVDVDLRNRREAFGLLDPDQLTRKMSKQVGHTYRCSREYEADPNSCFLFYATGKRGKTIGRHHSDRFKTFLSREIGVTVAEFQNFINPDISGPELTISPINPYYDSELKRIYQSHFSTRCEKNDRCVRPSHLILFYDGHPYTVADDPIPLSIPETETLLTRSQEVILIDAYSRASGAKKRIPQRLRPLERDIQFYRTSPVNAKFLAYLEDKKVKILLQEQRLDEWLSVYSRNPKHPTPKDLEWLLQNLPHLKP